MVKVLAELTSIKTRKVKETGELHQVLTFRTEERPKLKPFFHYGYTEITRICIGLEFIGGSDQSGLMLSFLWWFIVLGLRSTHV